MNLQRKDCLDCGMEMTFTAIDDGQELESGYHCEMCEVTTGQDDYDRDVWTNIRPFRLQ